MKFALFSGLGGTPWSELLDTWRHLDATGWDAACVTDHFMPNTKDRVGDTLECWTRARRAGGADARGCAWAPSCPATPTAIRRSWPRWPPTSTSSPAAGSSAASARAGRRTSTRPTASPSTRSRERLARLDEACQRDQGAVDPEPKADYKGKYYQLDDAPLDAQAGAEAPSRADDRRRRREGHAAHRGPARRPLERVGRAEHAGRTRAGSSSGTAPPWAATPRASSARRSWCWA